MHFRYLIPLIALSLSACSSVPMLPNLKPYKMDVQQGNVVTQEMVAKLQPGMTKAQVRFILGSPLIVDAFHNDRWDYVYRLDKQGKLAESRKITVIFDNDKLTQLEGDVVPGAGLQSARPAATAPQAQTKAQRPAGASQLESDKAGSAPKTEPAKDPQKEGKGFFGRMLEKLGL